jgi:hypothetical protein
MEETFLTWAVYKERSKFIARCWATKEGKTTASKNHLLLECDTLKEIHDTLEALGLVMLMPMPGDDPAIIETWI